jgi:hypothetical protein
MSNGTSKVLEGATVKVFVNGSLLGWAAGINLRIRTPVRQAHGIDSSTAFEAIPTTYSVTATMTVYRGRHSGGAEGAGLAASGENLLKQKYATIELVDRLSNAVIAKLTECMVTDQAWSYLPKQLVTGQISLDGINHQNESEG